MGATKQAMINSQGLLTVYAGLSHTAGKDAGIKVKPFSYLALSKVLVEAEFNGISPLLIGLTAPGQRGHRVHGVSVGQCS